MRDVRTLPWAWYSDPEVERLEGERIFRRAWQYVVRLDGIPERGYAAAQAGTVPVVVTRDGAGELRAFANVCRHRGSLVATGSARRESLQCPYHAWTYGLDGRLRAVPRGDREPALDTGELGLLPVAVDTWGPLVFVNPEVGAEPLAATLGDVPARLADAGVDVGALRFHRRVEYELAANWKIACENFLECYHCAVAHPGFSARLDVAADAYRLEARGLVSSQLAPVRAGGRGFDAAGEVPAGQFHFVWPNLKVNVYPGRPNLSLGPVLPDGPERSRGFLDYFFAPDADEGWIDEVLAFDDEVGAEDAELVASVQRGVASGMVADGRLLPESEQLVAHFQRLVAEALAD
jgi:phenylpropionate dioxygenase-like ring-hydroxylating dioxygenase large terminal subunit